MCKNVGNIGFWNGRVETSKYPLLYKNDNIGKSVEVNFSKTLKID